MECDICRTQLTSDPDKPDRKSYHFNNEAQVVGEKVLMFRKCEACKTAMFYRQVQLFYKAPDAWPPVKEATEQDYLAAWRGLGQKFSSTASEYSKRVARGADQYPPSYA